MLIKYTLNKLYKIKKLLLLHIYLFWLLPESAGPSLKLLCAIYYLKK